MKKLFSIMKDVKKFLIKYPELRDDDERLMANIWMTYIDNLENKNGTDILGMIAKHKLPSYESISRCRRKIQETTPRLRGEKWVERQKRAKKIRKEIVL